jgi:two-component system chemotaxis response regulator CheB
LPAILDRAGPLPAAHPRDGEPIVPGNIYVAPPDHHLALDPGRVRVSHGPRENRHRPAIDRLFRSAAHAYRRRVVGVILSGTLDDGVGGLLVIKQYGGLTIVQEPKDALYRGMPDAALEHVPVDYLLSAPQIGDRLAELAGPGEAAKERIGPVASMMPVGATGDTKSFNGPDEGEVGPDPGITRDTEATIPSAFVCPECGGSLWEVRDAELVRYRCRVGHSYTQDTLWADHTDNLEAALWTALRLLEENADLALRLAQRARENGLDAALKRFEERASEASAQAKAIQHALRRMARPADELPL